MDPVPYGEAVVCAVKGATDPSRFGLHTNHTAAYDAFSAALAMPDRGFPSRVGTRKYISD